MELLTPRLRLRELRTDDEPGLLAYLQGPEMRRFLLRGQGTPAYVHRFVAGARACARRQPRVFYGLAVDLLPDHALIGCVTLTKTASSLTAFLGGEIAPDFWNCGYATEALGALLAFAFQEGFATTVCADCFAANVAMARVLHKLGMRRSLRLSDSPWALQLAYRELRPLHRHHLSAAQWLRQRSENA